MDQTIDITSYINREPSDEEFERNQNTRHTIMRSFNTGPSVSTRRQLMYEKPEARRETTFKAPLMKVPSQRNIPNDRRLTGIPMSSYASQPRTSSPTSSNYSTRTTTLRSMNTSSLAATSPFRSTNPSQESKSEKILRDELTRLRTAFDVYRKDCNAKIQSILATNTSLMEDLCELKAQLNSVTSKLVGREVFSKRAVSTKSTPAKQACTNNLLDELSEKLLQCPEFKEKVLEVIEEREHEISEDERLVDELIKPTIQASPMHREFSFNNTYVKEDASPRSTIIRDETFVVEEDGDNEFDHC